MTGPETYPYYILTPDYKTSSLGIQVMHYLCHLLNEKGHQAWLVNTKPNPEWNTPLLTDKLLNLHRSQGIPGIAVYPEIVSGNPLKTSVVARYMLNREGVMNGNTVDAGPNDLFFWYRSEFAEKTVDPLLRLELYNLDLFCDDNPVKDINLLYLNRIPESLIDFSKLPEDIEILSMKNPLSLEQLAVKLKRARVLYTFESSGTNALAILCGCPVVALTIKGLEKYAVTPATLKDTGAAGYAWDDKPETLTKVCETMGDLRQKMLARREQSQLQLAHFIEKTQGQAMKCWQKRRSTFLQQWLMYRQLPGRHPALLKGDQLPRLMVIIHLHDTDKEKLQQTLQSVVTQQVKVDVLAVIPAGMKTASLSGVHTVSADRFLTAFPTLINEGKYDWVHNIAAGVTLSSGAYAVLLQFLATTNANAVAGDELWSSKNDQSWQLKRKNHDWELYTRSPHIYLKRWFISCQAIRTLSQPVVEYSPAFECEILFKIQERFNDQAFAYIDDVLMSIDSASSEGMELKPYCKLVEERQIYAGYEKARVEITDQNIFKVKYSHPEQPMVSVIILVGENFINLQNIITGFLEKNGWVNYELLIVNHQHNFSEIHQWLNALASIDPEKIRVINAEISYSRHLLHSCAVEHARGSYFLFLDNEIIFVTSNWLNQLMEQAQRSDVGCVGAKLINKEQKIVSAGIGFNCNGFAEHIGQGLIWHSLVGHAQLLSVYQPAFLDVHCWLVSRDCWEKVEFSNGNSQDPILATADFMFRVQKAGFKIITASDSIMVFNGTVREFTPEMQTAFQQMRSEHLSAHGRQYNGNFTLDGFHLITINDERLDSRWLAQQQTTMPLFVTLGEVSSTGYARHFVDFLESLRKKETVRVIHCDAIPDLHNLFTWNPQYLVFLDDLTVPDEQLLTSLKTQRNTQIFRLAGEILGNKSLASWLHSSALDSWLVYTAEQADWLKKRKQTVIEITPLFDTNVTLERKNNPHSPLRVLCDMRFLIKREQDFLTPVIQKTAKYVDWLVYGDCPGDWREGIHEIHRLRPDVTDAENIASLAADIAVFPRLMDGSSRLRDNYGQLLYLSHNLQTISNRSKDLTSDFDAWYTTTETNDWIQILLTIAERKRVDKGKELYRLVEFNQRYVMNEITIAQFLGSLTTEKKS